MNKNKALALALVVGVFLGITGCADDHVAYADQSAVVAHQGTVEYCDSFGCQLVEAPYYYDGSAVVYYDAYYRSWISPYGWWHNGIWSKGFINGFHSHYGTHFYHGARFGSHWAGGRIGHEGARGGSRGGGRR